jgi:hypothetical protein
MGSAETEFFSQEHFPARAFSSEVDTGSHKENASKQKTKWNPVSRKKMRLTEVNMVGNARRYNPTPSAACLPRQNA